MAGGPTPRPSSASERKKLIDEYTQAKRSEAERHTTEQAEAIRRKRLAQRVALVVTLVVSLYLSFYPPGWLVPPAQPVPTAAEREASIRFSMFLQAQQIEHFRATRGRLPGSLAETGQPLPGIRYNVLNAERYQLDSDADRSIRYASGDSLYAFLGESMARLGPSQ